MVINIMKKALRIYFMIFIVSLAAVHSAFAETGIKATVDNKTGKVTVSGCFDGTSNTPAGIYVLAGNVESLDGITPAEAGKYINHTEQVYTDENGEFSFSYLLGKTEGKYVVHAALWDGSKTADTYFIYITNDTIEECIKKAEQNRDPKNTNDDLEERTAAMKEIFSSAELLNAFDVLETSLPMGKKLEYIDDEVFGYMASAENPFKEKKDITEAVIQSVAVKLFNNAQKDDFANIIKECSKHFGLSEKIYNIYSGSDEVKSAVNEMLLKYTSVNAAGVREAITECVTLYRYRKMTHYTEFMSFVKEVDNAMNLDVDFYNTIKAPRDASNVDKAMLECRNSISSLEDMRKEFKAQVQAELDRKVTTSGGSTGGGGGSSSGGGSPVSSIGVSVSENISSVKTQNNELFKDINDVPWAKDAIISLAERGIVAGYDDGTYRPDSSIKREEASKIIVAALGMYDKNAVCSFEDVAQSEWYAPYIASAYQRSIISGIGNNRFGTGADISRQDMAVIVYNALSMLGVQYDEAQAGGGFSDGDIIADYAEKAVGALRGLGIINGDEANRFNPHNSLTRAEMAKIMSAVLDITDNI